MVLPGNPKRGIVAAVGLGDINGQKGVGPAILHDLRLDLDVPGIGQAGHCQGGGQDEGGDDSSWWWPQSSCRWRQHDTSKLTAA